MKKKIINGIMMVALVAATSTSFVSCKDTNEDVRVEMQQEYATLLGKLNTLEAQYGDLDGRVSTLETKVTNMAGDIETLQDEVDELELWLVEAFAKLVYGVEISGTYNNMLGSINIPGFEPKMLISNWGTADKKVIFPTYADYEGDKLTIAQGEEIGTSKEVAGFSGYIYANVNRYLDSVPLLSTAQDEDALFDITIANTAGEDVDGLLVANTDEKGGPTSDVLNWGWTRADNNIYKFMVAYTGEAAKTFAPAKIDLSLFKADLKQVWADRNRATGTSKEALGKLVADLYYNLATKDYNMKKYALKFKWEDGAQKESNADYTADASSTTGDVITYDSSKEEATGVEHIVTSEAELVFSTIKPLGFESGDAFAQSVGNNISSFNHLVEKSEVLWNKIFDKIKSKLPNLSDDQISTIIEGGDLEIVAGQWILHSGLGDIDLSDIINPLNTSLENVKTMLAQAQSLVDKLNGKTVTNWVEKFTNKFNTLFQNNAAQMLTPTLLAINAEGTVNRVSGLKASPYVADGEITLQPTSYTAELFAPAYAKFVGCKDIDADGFNEILYTTNNKTLKFTPKSGTTYEIVYEAVDFFGNHFEHTYYIQGK